MAPILPEALYAGRTNLVGPAIGPYCCFTASHVSVPISQTDLIIWSMQAPFSFRLEQIEWAVIGTNVTGTIAIEFYKKATLAVSGATDLLAAAIDADAAPISYAGIAAGGTTTIVAAAREIAKDDYIFIGATTDGTGLIEAEGMSVSIWGFSRGHVNADEAND